MHEETRLEGRVNGTDLTNPDFLLLAKAYGAHGERVTCTKEFAPRLRTLPRRRQTCLDRTGR
ncbi:hypothetical protein Q1M63_00755 (plasmid) [Sinorhizobium meliloti]|nr:hypothetical protein Q1M63_00755 [Sinorhizobium meliloti]